MEKIYITSINQPSPWLEGFSAKKSFEIQCLLNVLKDSLEKAGLSLTMFENCKQNSLFTEDLPRNYQFKMPFLFAHSFIFTLDEINKVLAVLKNKVDGIPPTTKKEISEAYSIFNKNIIGIKDVRDSAHHIEDRIRGKKREEKKIKLRPINSGGIFAPNGGVLIISSIINNRLAYTTEDGSLKEIEISERTLKITQDVLQKVFNGFNWKNFNFPCKKS